MLRRQERRIFLKNFRQDRLTLVGNGFYRTRSGTR
jgi:hypothetical protein